MRRSRTPPGYRTLVLLGAVLVAGGCAQTPSSRAPTRNEQEVGVGPRAMDPDPTPAPALAMEAPQEAPSRPDPAADTPKKPFRPALDPATSERATATLTRMLRDNGSLSKHDSLRARDAKQQSARDWTLFFTHLYRGLPVEQSGVVVSFTSDGHLSVLEESIHRKIAVRVKPSLSAAEVLAIHAPAAGAATPPAAPVELVVLPVQVEVPETQHSGDLAARPPRFRYHLAYRIPTAPGGRCPIRRWVDAHTGKILREQQMRTHCGSGSSDPLDQTWRK